MSALTLTAVALIGAGALIPGAAASVPPPAPVAVANSPVLVDCTDAPQTLPASYVLACGDGNNYLISLKWSQWGPTGARAVGTDVANDCVPYCAAGHFHDYPVYVSLDRALPWDGHPGVSRFTRVTLVYPDARPAGAPVTTSFPLSAGRD
ncbi:hypothetical protein [Streptacidiphilus sp. EB129]|jgi:hypothetical protein|uniref:hypothetical protein n=1 Tax=Streptacidiphilus sp. EB129 TaxID=3156262 RepID=UPI0035128175